MLMLQMLLSHIMLFYFTLLLFNKFTRVMLDFPLPVRKYNNPNWIAGHQKRRCQLGDRMIHCLC